MSPAGGALKAASFEYDNVGRVVRTTDGNGDVTNYRYDALDRPVEVRLAGAADCSDATLCQTLTYDGNGNVRTRQEASGTTTYTYDALNRMTSQTLDAAGGSQVSTMTYDLMGNLTALTDAGGTVTYGYNAANELVSLAEPGGSCAGTISGCTTFTYDANGVRTQVNHPGGTKVQHLGTDASGRPLQYKATNAAGAVLMDFTYSSTTPGGKDSSLVQSRRDNTVSGIAVQTYSHDGRNQLTRVLEKVAGAMTASWAYCYDANGNRTFDSTSTAASIPCPGQTGGPAPTYTYVSTDALIDRVGAPEGAFAYDGNGAELSGVGINVRSNADWNAAGQLTALTTDGAEHAYSYTGMGNAQRTTADGKTFTNTGLGVTAQTGADDHAVVRGPNGRLVALRSGGASYYFIADRQGSTIALVDSAGAVRNSYAYDPYGQSRAKTETVPNPWQYIGGYLDEGGLYHLQARYYDPALGRFTQRDPSGQDPHYLYANNNPITFSDPSGLSATGWANYGCGPACDMADPVYVAPKPKPKPEPAGGSGRGYTTSGYRGGAATSSVGSGGYVTRGFRGGFGNSASFGVSLVGTCYTNSFNGSYWCRNGNGPRTPMPDYTCDIVGFIAGLFSFGKGKLGNAAAGFGVGASCTTAEHFI